METVSWGKLPQYFYQQREVGLSLNAAAMFFPLSYGEMMEPQWQQAYEDMARLEKGDPVNAAENRPVGHYWLRAPHLALTPQINQTITKAGQQLRRLAADIRCGQVKPPNSQRYSHFLLIGIGGSILGSQLLTEACAKNSSIAPFFLDNTDPDGMDKIWQEILPHLASTLIIVASKSGKTMETLNGLREAEHLFAANNLYLPSQAVAITLEDSPLAAKARAENWLALLPIWPWIGGRTSITSAMGLFPAALLDINIDLFLKGAALMDISTRQKQRQDNPAALLSLIWSFAVQEKGWQQMVILPYRDGLSTLPLYLQQLIMESLGKETINGNGRQHHGITVFGNKGTTDHHSYIQQLMQGPENTFVNFIESRQDRRPSKDELDSGDYLRASLYGLRKALAENGRPSLTITIERLDPLSLGALIALFERAVGFYASMMGINAYDQPGVEQGKLETNLIINQQKRLLEFLTSNKNCSYSVDELAEELCLLGEEESIWNIMENVVLNHPQLFSRHDATNLFSSRYSCDQ